MKKIKIIIIVLLMFVLCGCSGEYNLTFNEDLTLKEELNVTIDNNNDNFEKTYNIFEKADIDPNKYEIITKDNDILITYTEEYTTLEEYLLNSHLYHVLFNDINYKKDNVGMKLETESNFKLDDTGNDELVNSYDIDNLKINIKVPFSMNKSNEDSKSNDIYTWELNKNDTYKKISMDFSYKKASVLSIVLLITISVIVLAFLALLARNFIKTSKL